MDVETETHQDRDICWMSRQRNFLDVETKTHRDWENLLDVETETSQDWEKDVDTETLLRLSLIISLLISNLLISS